MIANQRDKFFLNLQIEDDEMVFNRLFIGECMPFTAAEVVKCRFNIFYIFCTLKKKITNRVLLL
jgi:hypothetical protein